jgi:general secretion pathway protein D
VYLLLRGVAQELTRKILLPVRSHPESNRISLMRSLTLIAVVSLLTSAAAGTAASKTELRNQRRANKEYVAAVESIRSGDIEKGRTLLEKALRFDPRNVAALSAQELLRQCDIQQNVIDGNRQLASNQREKAIESFRHALSLDSNNSFAQDALRSALADNTTTTRPRIQYRDADDIRLEPREAKQDFHFKGDSRGLLQQLWNAYGIRPLIDNSVANKQLRFELDSADFATATLIASKMTDTFYVPLSSTQALLVADTPENRRSFERLALRTFYVSDAASTQEITQQINDVAAMLRAVFDFRFVTPAPSSRQLTVRAPLSLLDPATRILEDLFSGKPQVMLEVNVLQVEQTLARDLGIGLPTQFTLFNVNTEARKLLNGANQNVIDQLISSGAINQANSSSIAALLAGLAAGGSSILNQPIVTFGGGISQTGLIIPGTSIHASLSKSSLQSIEHLMLRAAQGDAAVLRNGTRYPILNASFAPIFNNPAISQVIGNQSFRAPFPSFSYEDLGLTLKATPTIHSRDVSLKLEFQLRGLGAAQLNGVPVITNREYNANITVPMGETAVLAGMVSRSEQLSLQGLPGISRLPIFGAATSVRNKQTDDAELLITIRPHLVRDALHDPEAGIAFVPSER